MNFGQAVKSVYSNYVNFTGRAMRSEFWYFMLFYFIAYLVLAFIDLEVLGGQILTSLFALATLLPGIGVAVRRLHDIDKSGWLILLNFIPLIGAIILIVWYCQAGTPGPNRFGPAPVAGMGAAALAS